MGSSTNLSGYPTNQELAAAAKFAFHQPSQSSVRVGSSFSRLRIEKADTSLFTRCPSRRLLLKGWLRIPYSKDFAVSSIWDEPIHAEKHLQTDGVDRRKSKRSKLHVSLLVCGSDGSKRPFHEQTETLNANERGCLVSLEASVVRGQHLVVVNLSNQDERECRVVHLSKLLQGKRQVAVEFLRPAPEFWFDS